MARKRGLSDAERKLWAQVARSASPLHPPDRPTPAPERMAAPRPAASPRGPAFADSLPDFRIGQDGGNIRATMDHAPSPAERLAAGPLRMDLKTHKRMKQGRLRPEAKLDLHGMTLAIAHPELIRFILSCQTAGMRLVLVITGKGRGSDGPLPTRPGALRHQVPHWLELPPLTSAVQQVTPAHLRHGGEGAYYVYLRRLTRPNGVWK